jgi:xanthine dehydrogenase accessory factor
MRDILTDVERWQKEGVAVALATVVRTWGSSPRRVGAKMAVTSDGRMSGSVSGGCVENAVVQTAMDILKTGQSQLLHFGVADETAWEVGLACGGSIDVFVKRLDTKFFEQLRSLLMREASGVLLTVIRGDEKNPGHEMLITEDGIVYGSLGNEWDATVLNLAREVLSHGASQSVLLSENVEVFMEAILPPTTLVVVGGVHIAIALVSLAKTLGYRTILVDPRSSWGSDERFPHVDRLIESWIEEAFEQIPINRSTAIAMLTHDPKIDDPALQIALNSSAFYVGALGSRTTNAKRRERLLSAGLTEAQLSRLHAPIGLDIGAQTPEEIALAVMSEVVAAHRKQNQVEVKNEAESVSH